MKPGIITAIVVSVVLIIGALWFRFSTTVSTPNNLVALPADQLPDTYYEDVIAKFLEPPATPSSTISSEEKLSTTDLVARQMVLDYLGLAQNGQATPANLSALAMKYIDTIPNALTPRTLLVTDLHVVSNSAAAYTAYGDAFNTAYQNYSTKLAGAYVDTEVIGAASSKMAVSMAKTYTEMASILSKLSVPAALMQLHLSLINIYLANAASMNAITRAETDPASSFAGLILLKANASKEEEIVGNLRKSLATHGV